MSRYLAAAALLVTLGSRSLTAQIDFYNTSSGRPLRIEDANPVEYRAIELNLTSLRLDLHRGSARSWSLDPEATIGVLPRTHFQIALPLSYIDTPATETGGLSGIEISGLYALNMETSIPALSVAATVSLPAGPLGGRGTYGTLKGIVTRTLPWARFHVNAQLTTGPGRTSIDDGRDLNRWLAGLAIDKAFPLHSLLVMAESYAEDPLDGDATVAWNAAAGVRYQLSTRWALDGGVGRRFTGDDRAWHVTFGTAYALGVP